MSRPDHPRHPLRSFVRAAGRNMAQRLTAHQRALKPTVTITPRGLNHPVIVPRALPFHPFPRLPRAPLK